MKRRTYPKGKKPKLKSYKRTLHIDGEEWTYRIAGSFNVPHVFIASPDCSKKWNIPAHEITGVTFDEYEWDFDEEYYLQILPSDIKNYIISKIIKCNTK